MTSSSPSASSNGRVPTTTLQRGRACLSCRRRKIRCDGARPACGSCRRYDRADDCEYDDGYMSPHMLQLQETVSRLEARVQEIAFQDPPEAGSQILLSHRKHPSLRSLRSGSNVQSSVGFFFTCGIKHSRSRSPVAGSVHGVVCMFSAVAIDLMLNHHSRVDAYFRHNKIQNSWFLHEGRFRGNLYLPTDNIASLVPTLVTTVHLWGVRLLGREDLDMHATALLSRALIQLGDALYDMPSQRTVQVIQTHVLLALYLYDAACFLDARTHTAAAASLVLRLGLHKIRSTSQSTLRPFTYVEPIASLMPPPRDAVEEGERIAAFWAVFKQDRISAAILGLPVAVSDIEGTDTQVDTPWPMTIELYEEGMLAAGIRSGGTLKTFLSGLSSNVVQDSSLAQTCKAAALFERATRLVNGWTPDLPMSDEFYAEYVSLSARIDEQKDQRAMGDTPYKTLCVLNGASIQLHTVFAAQSEDARDKCLDAAFAIIQASTLSRLQDIKFLCPATGTIWAAVCRVLINGIISVRSMYADTPMPSLTRRETELVGMLEQMVSLMASFAPISAIMSMYPSNWLLESWLTGV
ncbi:hypothetical protein K488DRAFT_57718 [Vararia minispora EC-137]|uniref:Uncharacterized protein n=1 Tax=Vararia minispora EC-137 TaxID=1314806 RepID=A0ACB8QAE6_9AGAM|nr:hypothetical protein K488DRAFT_57718 [Vararia minispora EC-137]